MTLLTDPAGTAVSLPARQRILAYETELARHPQGHFPVQHHFAPGQYGREIFMAAGSQVVGKIHRHAHVNVLSMGRCLVFTETGGVEELVAPKTWVSQPGTKRCVKVIEDTLWTTFHCNPTDTRDIAQLERDLIAPDYETLDGETIQ